MERYKNYSRIALRLLKEFWAPFSLASGWAVYATAGNSITVQSFATAFAPAFFLTSWALGQFFRIAKHTKDDSTTEQIIATLTGGAAFPKVDFTFEGNEGGPILPLDLVVDVRGGRTLYDLSIYLLDVDALWTRGAAMSGEFNSQQIVGTMGSGYLRTLFNVETESRQRLIYHFDAYARNGSFDGRVVAAKIGDDWFSAVHIRKERKTIFERKDHLFPATHAEFLDPDQDVRARMM